MPETIPEDGAAQLIEYVGGQPAVDSEFAAAKWAEAKALVTKYVGEADVPDEVLTGAILEVGSKLWARRAATGNEAQVDTITAGPIMPARDPMTTVYATLNRFLPGGFA